MEQRIAAAVGIQPVAHILPGGDLVHGFVGDQLLEQRGRRVPVDGAQVEEAGVEPRQQQLAQVVVEALEIGVVAAQRQQVGAKVDQELHPLRQRVELGEETPAGRLDREGDVEGKSGLISVDTGVCLIFKNKKER